MNIKDQLTETTKKHEVRYGIRIENIWREPEIESFVNTLLKILPVEVLDEEGVKEIFTTELQAELKETFEKACAYTDWIMVRKETINKGIKILCSKYGREKVDYERRGLIALELPEIDGDVVLGENYLEDILEEIRNYIENKVGKKVRITITEVKKEGE